MMKTRIHIIVIFTIFLVCGPGSLYAKSKLPSVAVVSLDLPVNKSAEQSVLKTLSNANVNVISPEELQARLEKAQSPIPTPKIAGKFARMSALISKGIEKFFYESEKKSIQKLQPVFDMGMNNIHALARRADYADQIFQAGILLIRAYKIRNKKENADAIVRLIVGNFPTQSFSASVIPPKLIRRLENARLTIAKDKTTIELVNHGSSECEAYLNGFSAPLNTPIFVKPDTNYHIRLDCGVEDQTVWQTKLKKGEKLAVPLNAGNPLIIGLSKDDLQARQIAETSLQAVMFWANIDHIVGVSESFKEGGNVLVVRIQKGESPRWSDGASKKDVYKALIRVFPELGLTSNDEEESVSQSGEGEWLGWVLMGTGVAVAGTGVYLWFGTLDKQKELECGYGNLTDCDGIRIRDPESKDFIADQDAVDSRILASYVLYGVGGVAFAYGLYRVLTQEESTAGLSVAPLISPEGAGLQFHTTF